MTSTATDGDLALAVENVSKNFGAIRALENISFSVRKGEILGLVGDNGAGKSTTVKIISGVHQPDDGTVRLEGEEVDFRSPKEARTAGVETVYQDLALVDSLDVAANFFLGREVTRPSWLGGLGLLRHKKMRRRAAESIDDLHVKIPGLVSDEISEMSGGQRQAVAIARAAFWRSRLVLLDEPTASLGVEESSEVLKLVESMAEEGLPIILISHNMEDVWRLCDRICVLRQGQKVIEVDRDDTTKSEIVEYITGAAKPDHDTD